MMSGGIRLWVRLAAISGFVAVGAGAFAAHAMSDPAGKELMRTGSTYEAMHALATLAWAGLRGPTGRAGRVTPIAFLLGTLLFSGSLYALAAGAPRWVGAVTPLGGLLFLAGWASLIWTAGGLRQPAGSEVPKGL